jgi:polygalacturonase
MPRGQLPLSSLTRNFCEGRDEMRFQISAVFRRSITVELLNDRIYSPETPLSVQLNGREWMTVQTNVFSLYGLLPNQEYTISIDGESQTFTTKKESFLLDVRSFGTCGDGIREDTSYLQAAILSCPEGGTVYIPSGKYRSGPLFLKSHMTLYLEKDAEILGLTDRDRYPILPGMTDSTDESREINFGSWEGNPLPMFASLITAIDCEDIDITGEGTINGCAAGGDWWMNLKEKDGAWRPNLIYFCRCRDIRMQGLTLTMSPSWTLHPYYSDHLAFYDLRIRNPYDSPNTDGLDPENCGDILILGVRISVGDDCIAIKSGKLYMAKKHLKRTQNIEIRNCLLENGHGAVTVGSEIACGVDSVHVSRCIFRGTDRGIRLKSRRGRGEASLLDGLYFEKIQMDAVHMPLTINMFYSCDPDGHSDYVQSMEALPVDERTPAIGRICLTDIDCSGIWGSLVTAYGLPERKIGCIDLENIRASFAEPSQRQPEQTIMADCVPYMNGRSFVLHNIEKVRLSDIKVCGSDDRAPELVGVKEEDIRELRYEP